MDTNDDPILYIRELWQREPLEFVVPAIISLGALQLTVALFVLRSANWFVFFACLGVAIYAAIRTGLFLQAVLGNARLGLMTEVTIREVQQLLGSVILGVALYAVFAPNERLGLFFACMSLPYFLSVTYLIKRQSVYAGTATAPTLTEQARALKELVPTPQAVSTAWTRFTPYVAALRSHSLVTFHALRARIRLALSAFRKNPDFRSS
jgi:hypothetical protein